MKTLLIFIFLFVFSLTASAQVWSANAMKFGDGSSGTSKSIIFNTGSGTSNPRIRWDTTTGVFQLSLDNSSWQTIGDAPGNVITSAATACPSGTLLMDGTAYSRATYANLFAAIRTAYGVGDGSTTFNVPDTRGQFLRQITGAAITDPDATSRTQMVASTFTIGSGATTNGSPNITMSSTANLAVGMTVSGTNIPASTVIRSITNATTAVMGNLGDTANVNATGSSSSLTFTFSKAATGNYQGSVQADAFESHTHQLPTTYQGTNQPSTLSKGDGVNVPQTQSTLATGGNETRPNNVYIRYCIRF